MTYSLNELYNIVGLSKQAVHQYERRQLVFEQRVELLLSEVEELRRSHPGCGLEKMYGVLQPDFLGRDRFVSLLKSLGYQLSKRPNYQRTTRSVKQRYANLIQGLHLDSPCIVWQSDITYILVQGRYYYAVFIIDVYTKIIVGYRVSDHMRASANVAALRDAISQYGAPCYHHSDHGSQYGYSGYVKLLSQYRVKISRADRAPDNAYAERINRTIKEEYLNHWQPQSYDQLKKMMARAVKHYNQERHHRSLGKISPVRFAQYWANLTVDQRPKEIIFRNESLT